MAFTEHNHVAQINIGKILGPMDGPVMFEFAANLERINKLAEQSDGFIWRLKDDSNSATSLKFFEDDLMIINMSVWANIETLYNFTYQTMHAQFLKRRKEWFAKMTEVFVAIWFVPAGNIPTPQEALERLEHLKKFGSTPYAFTFKNKFTVEEYEHYLEAAGSE